MADLDFVVDLQFKDLRGSDYLSGKRKFWNLRNHDIPQTPGASGLCTLVERVPCTISVSPAIFASDSAPI